MTAQHIITDFSAGELSPRIFTRGFSEKYQTGCEELTNFTLLPQGGAFKTPGFKHVLAAYAATSSRGIPFSMAHEDDIDIDLELGNLYCRIVKDGTVINSGSNLTTPWATADLAELQYAQDDNVIYVAHPDYATRKITRTSDASWAIATAVTDIPKYAFGDASSPSPSASSFTLTEGGSWASGENFVLRLTVNSMDFSTAAIPYSGVFATLVSNVQAAIYDALNIYGLVVLYGYPDVTVQETTDPEMEILFDNNWASAVTALTVESVNSTSGTMTEGGSAGSGGSEDVWSATRGYPRAVAFHEQRLILGGTSALPGTLWGSATAQPAVFSSGVNDADPFSYQIKGGRQGVTIQWLESKRLLCIGTSSGERVQHEVPLTPTSVQFLRHTSRKSAYLQPVEVDSELFYVQRGKRRLRKFAFEETSQNWETIDATFLADHMPNAAITQLGYAEMPDSVIYGVTEDLFLICMTYDRVNRVGGWWRRVSPADIISAWTIHNPTTGMDEIHAIVEYASSRYLWKLRATSERVLADAKDGDGIVRHQKSGNYDGYLDGYVVQNGASTTTVTGLPWADGTTVKVVGDDALQADATVSSGGITAAVAAENFVVGLGYSSILKTLPLEGLGGQSVMGKKRRFNPFLRVVDSAMPLVNGNRPPDRATDSLMDTAPSLRTGDVRSLVLGHQTGGQITIEADLPLPCQVTGIFGDVRVGD